MEINELAIGFEHIKQLGKVEDVLELEKEVLEE